MTSTCDPGLMRRHGLNINMFLTVFCLRSTLYKKYCSGFARKQRPGYKSSRTGVLYLQSGQGQAESVGMYPLQFQHRVRCAKEPVFSS